MANYDNTNKGVLFSNKRRTKDTHPTHTGSINVDGREFWLNAWVNEKRDGTHEKYFSISITPKDEQGTAKTGARDTSFDSIDDDIPF